MKKCELCNSVARMYCDSDQASLCWDCDSRVHAANFIVAKHTRTLLCHGCQSPTPWTGSGSRFGPTVSVCRACVRRRDGLGNVNADGEDDGDEDAEEEEEEEEEDDGDEEEEDDEDEDVDCKLDDDENQVVPLSLPPVLASSSSSNEEPVNVRGDGVSSSGIGLFNPQNSRFSYNGVERPEEKKGSEKMRSWKWR